MSVIEAMARAQYDKYMSGVSDLEPEWSGLRESHRTRMRESLCAALKAAEALGWKLVPVEPTNKMMIDALQAGLDHMRAHGVDGLSPWQDYPKPSTSIKICYRAMLAASPSIEENKP